MNKHSVKTRVAIVNDSDITMEEMNDVDHNVNHNVNDDANRDADVDGGDVEANTIKFTGCKYNHGNKGPSKRGFDLTLSRDAADWFVYSGALGKLLLN